jgi:hypothetical protein
MQPLSHHLKKKYEKVQHFNDMMVSIEPFSIYFFITIKLLPPFLFTIEVNGRTVKGRPIL